MGGGGGVRGAVQVGCGLFDRFRRRMRGGWGFGRLVGGWWVGLGVCVSGPVLPPAGERWVSRVGQGAEVVEHGLVDAGPGPSGGKAQQGAAAVVDDAFGDAVEAGAGGGAEGGLLVGVDVAEVFGPSDQVAGEDCAGVPGGVGFEIG